MMHRHFCGKLRTLGASNRRFHAGTNSLRKENGTPMKKETLSLDLQAGDYVVIRGRAGRSIHGLVEQCIGGSQWMARTVRGDSWRFDRSSVSFRLPDLVLQQLSNQFLPWSAGRSLVLFAPALTTFLAKAKDLTSKHRPQLDSFYQQNNQQPSLTVSSLEVAKFAFNTDEPTSMQLCAANTYLRSSPVFYVNGHDMDFNTPILDDASSPPLSTLLGDQWQVRPADQVASLQQMQRHVRQRSPELSNFLTKLRNILGSDKKGSSNYAFTELEWSMLDTIKLFASAPNGANRAIVGPILMALQFRSDTSENAAQLLMNLGVWCPWDHYGASPYALKYPNQADELTEQLSQLTVAETSTEFSPENDDMHSIRHDFGNLTAFTIDDAHASEIDDALSVEWPWIHVHVADPTAFASPQSAIGRQALQLVSNLYLAEGTFPIFPDTIVQRSTLGNGSARPTLTLSARFDENGNIVESLVRPGLIRRIKALPYERVDHLLKEHASESSPLAFPDPDISGMSEYFDAEADTSEMGNEVELSKEDIEAIRKLDEAAGWHFDRRMKSREGAFHPITVKPNIFLFPASDDDDQINVPWKRSMTPRFTESKPEIVLGYDLAATSRARMMVAEYMIMAGSKMAKFAKETNTPIIYRTQEAIFNSDSTSEGKQSSRDQRIQELLSCVQNGHLPFEKSIQIFGFLEASQMSTIDRPHVMLGLDHYLQATSPLRRAWDLIAHWQIKARLLQIHGHDTQLPFNENELDRMIARMQVRERRLKRLQQRNSQHWIREMFKPRDSSDRGISLYSDMVFEGIVREREQRVEGWNVFVKELASRFIVVDRNLVRGVRLQVGDRIFLRVDTSTSDRLDFIQAE